MRNVATSVRITPEANRAAAVLAGRMQASKAQVIEMALLNLEEKFFWQEVHDAYAKVSDDPAQLAAHKTEIAAWDETLTDGLHRPRPARKKKR